MSIRSKIMNEVQSWASSKRDGRIAIPDLVMSARDCAIWKMGYYEAMNDVAQHFNMERLQANQRSYTYTIVVGCKDECPAFEPERELLTTTDPEEAIRMQAISIDNQHWSEIRTVVS